MKTINFQLSSQKCIDEGYVVRPPSPLADQELVANPFEIEPMEWFTAGVGGAAGDPGSDDEGSEDESPFTYREKQSRKDVCVERFYPNEEKFLTMFPDGTGNVFYPNGQLAISVSSVERGKFTYIVYDTQPQEDAPQSQLAEFDPDAVATCYHKSGQIRLYLDQLGGMELHQDGSRKKRWHWLDTTTHMHAPPVQPLCFALNKYIGIRVLNQDNISMTFLSYQRSCRFNVGVKLKLIHPENLPLSADFSDDHIYMSEKANQVSGLLDKIENLLRYPHSIKADKIKEPKRVTIKAEKIQKYKNQATVARQKDKDRHTKKFSRPLPPLDPDIDPVLMTETGEIITGHSTHRGGRGKHPVVVVN